MIDDWERVEMHATDEALEGLEGTYGNGEIRLASEMAGGKRFKRLFDDRRLLGGKGSSP